MAKWFITICLGIVIVSCGGCAGKLPPREELTQAVNRSFGATGFNYKSKSRVMQFTLRNLDAKVPENKTIKNTDALLEIVRGFSLGIEGAIDVKSGKSEALYDLSYSKDNVDISIRLPLLVDYNKQTIYIGPSLLHTILDVASPKDINVRGKLIRIHLPDLLKDNSELSGRLSKLVNGKSLTPENMTAMKNVFRNTALKMLGKLDATRFSELPFSEQDGKTEIARRIQIRLGRGECIDLMVDFIDGVSQVLLREGLITEKELEFLKAIADRRKLEELLGEFKLSLTMEVGVSSTGYVAQVVSQTAISDRDGDLQGMLENISTFYDYNAPHFSINPENTRFIEFGDLMKLIKPIGKRNQPEDNVEDKKQEKQEDNGGPSGSKPPSEDAPADIDAG